jgi:hypothetical protein
MSVLASLLERKFQALPPHAGVVFVSIEPLPAPEGRTTRFRLVLGMGRLFEKDTGLALVKALLEKEIDRGLVFNTTVVRGVGGACRDSNPPPARTAAS